MSLRLLHSLNDVIHKQVNILPILSRRLLVRVGDGAGVRMGTAQQHLGRAEAGADAVHDELVDGQHVQRNDGDALRPIVEDKRGGGQVIMYADIAFCAVAVTDLVDSLWRGDIAAGNASQQGGRVWASGIRSVPNPSSCSCGFLRGCRRVGMFGR